MCFSFSAVFSPSYVFAQTDRSKTNYIDTSTLRSAAAQGLVPCGGATQPKCTVLHVFSLFGRLINFLIALSGFFAVFQIVRAGFSMVFAMGSSKGIEAGKDSLTNSVLGLCLVMMAYVLVNLVIVGVLDLKYTEILKNPFGYLCTDPKLDEKGKVIVNCY